MDYEERIARHYGSGGAETLETRILAALAKSGKDIAHLTAADLSGGDEFHLGWRAQTIEIGAALALQPDMKLLDIGCGIGGPARFFAEAHGCQVTGIDLTPEFVACASALTARCNLADQVQFRQASALALPFDEGTFDTATLIHVGMNIADKAKLFTEARRVLKPAAHFCVYDIMRVGDDPLPYPMPWAADSETSFVATPEVYRKLLGDAGFRITRERNRRDFTLALAAKMRAEIAANGPPALSLHVIIGPSAKERLGNVMAALERNLIAPVEFLAEAV
jgi:ubiquinone/menaquinone biosynthesis C-methylase UbiE